MKVTINLLTYFYFLKQIIRLKISRMEKRNINRRNFLGDGFAAIIGVDNVAQIEEDVKIASEFSPLCEAEMKEVEFKTLPIVRQELYCRRWDLGA